MDNYLSFKDMKKNFAKSYDVKGDLNCFCQFDHESEQATCKFIVPKTHKRS